MNNNKKFNIQFFAEEGGEGTPNANAGAGQEPAKTDYEKEFKALQEKYNSLNNDYIKKSDAYDKVSSENADYKRKERDKLSDEEKKKQELKDLMESNKKLEAEVATFKLEKELADNEFTVEERKIFMAEGLTPVTFAKVLKSRLEEQEKSIKASMIKDTTQSSLLGNGVGTGKEKSDFARYQEKNDTNVAKKVQF